MTEPTEPTEPAPAPVAPKRKTKYNQVDQTEPDPVLDAMVADLKSGRYGYGGKAELNLGDDYARVTGHMTKE